MVAGLATEKQVILYFTLGTVGSLLPDIDANDSVPIQITFSVASILLAFVTMFFFAAIFYSVMELVLIWLVTYLLLRWIIFALFSRLTTHRGIFHSLPAALFFGFVSAAVAHRVMGVDPQQAWMSGLFITYGYIVHLALDEFFSVNIFGIRTRRSFGSAMKLYSRGSFTTSLYMYLALMAAFIITPSIIPLTDVVLNTEILNTTQQRLFPSGSWFDWELRGVYP